MDGDHLFDVVRELELPVGSYAIYGSGPLIVRGVIEATNDLDLVSRSPAWDRAYELGVPTVLEEHGVEIVSFLDGAITVGRSWAYGDVDIDRIIDTAEVFDGLPFARLEYVVAYKEAAARPKDLRHLAALRDARIAD